MNFDTLVIDCFDKFFMDYVTPDVALNILMVFLREGIKTVFRFTYATLKLHKNFIKTITRKDELFIKLKSVEHEHGHVVQDLLFKKAFKYPLQY